MNIERASVGDFAELTDHIVRCFRTDTPDHPRFEEFLPDLYEPAAESAACHYVIREGGRIVSSVGVFPVEVRLSELLFHVAGVGSVSTAPECRGRGFMSAIMTALRADAAAAGFAFSWLSGLRQRYAHFGWEKAGTDFVIRVTRQPPPAGTSWTIRRLDAASDSLESLHEARAALVAAGECEEAASRRKLSRLGIEVFEARRGSDYAYLAGNRRFGWLQEWGGAVGGVRALLHHALGGKPAWLVRIPPVRDPYTDLFLSLGDNFACEMENLAVLDLPRLARVYERYWAGRWPPDKSLCLRMEPADIPGAEVCIRGGREATPGTAADVHLALDRLMMASFVFGPVKPSMRLALPAGAEWLDEVFPVPFHMPSLWRV
ncbi:MAG: hypothetical protein BWK77_02240 [Verrucomicrobia bacterium A1]|nr:MAG: hypothetical protein BWK77_02240 [Verrucomicrobia bacterium A1]